MGFSNKRFVGIALIVLASFSGTFAFRLSIPVVAFFTRDFLEATMFSVSAIFVVFMLSRALSSVTMGRLLESKKALVFAGSVAMIGNAILVRAYGFAASWTDILALRAINGVLNGVSWPIAQFVVTSTSPESMKSRVSSAYMIAGTVASIVANYVYAYTTKYPMNLQLMISSGGYIITGLLMFSSYFILYKDIVPKKVPKDREKSYGPKNVQIVNYLVITFLLFCSLSFMNGDVFYVYLSEKLSLSKEDTSKLVANISIVASILSYLVAWFADRKNARERVLKHAALIGSLSPLMIMVTFPPIMLLGTILGLTSLRVFTPLIRSYLASKATRVSLAFGSINMFQNMGVMMGQIFFGSLYDLLPSIIFGGLLFSPIAILGIPGIAAAILSIKLK